MLLCFLATLYPARQAARQLTRRCIALVNNRSELHKFIAVNKTYKGHEDGVAVFRVSNPRGLFRGIAGCCGPIRFWQNPRSAFDGRA